MKELKTVDSWVVEKEYPYKKGKVRSGISVNVTSMTKKGKKEVFDLAKQEVGKKAQGLDLYEVIDL